MLCNVSSNLCVQKSSRTRKWQDKEHPGPGPPFPPWATPVGHLLTPHPATQVCGMPHLLWAPDREHALRVHAGLLCPAVLPSPCGSGPSLSGMVPVASLTTQSCQLSCNSWMYPGGSWQVVHSQQELGFLPCPSITAHTQSWPKSYMIKPPRGPPNHPTLSTGTPTLEPGGGSSRPGAGYYTAWWI